MQTTTESIPLLADTYQPEVVNLLTELVDGYRTDTIETLEGIRSALFCINGVGAIYELPAALDLQVLALRMSLAHGKIHKYLRAKQALATLEVQ